MAIDREHQLAALCPRGWDRVARAIRADAARQLAALPAEPEHVIARRVELMLSEVDARYRLDHARRTRPAPSTREDTP